LLKAVHEPPPRPAWLCGAPSPGDGLTTGRSRCRGVHLRVPAPGAVADLLVRRDGLDPDVALAAARATQSHIGLARRLAKDPEARERRRRRPAVPAGTPGAG